jgi:hypothetical protein
MKKTGSLLLFMLSCLFTNAQDFEAWNAIKFTDATDYKAYEGTIAEISNYILRTPHNGNDENQKIAFRTLITWMSGTPDYSFAVDQSIAELMKNNDDVLGVYMAAMAQWSLGNKAKAKDLRALKLNAFITLLNYCESAENQMKQTKALKKAIAAKNEGTLEKYLNL